MLVLPERAFQADASEKDSINDSEACVWHGFLGTWKEEVAEEGQKEKGDPMNAAAAAAAAAARD